MKSKSLSFLGIVLVSLFFYTVSHPNLSMGEQKKGGRSTLRLSLHENGAVHLKFYDRAKRLSKHSTQVSGLLFLERIDHPRSKKMWIKQRRRYPNHRCIFLQISWLKIIESQDPQPLTWRTLLSDHHPLQSHRVPPSGTVLPCVSKV